MYRTIDGEFWTDPAVKRLCPNDKLLFLYFITNPVARVSGLYCVALPIICHETKLTDKQARKGIVSLTKEQFIEYDEAGETVWVRNMLKHQSGNNRISPKIIAAVAKDLKKVHNSCLIPHFLEHYDTLSIPYQYPIDRGAHSEYRVPSTERETERETERGDDTADAAPPLVVLASTIPTPFASLVGQWNTVCGSNGLPKVRTITEARKEKMRVRWKQEGFREGFPEALKAIINTPFLLGDNKRKWKVTFDWLIDNEGNWLKVIEGNYKQADSVQHGPDAQIPGVYYDSTGEIHLDPNAGAYDEEFVLQVEAEIRADMEQEGKNEEGKKKKTALTAAPPVIKGFDIFWDAYPKKKGKADARKAWDQVSEGVPPLNQIIAAIITQAKSPDWMKQQGQYIPYPATWLRGERWADEVGPVNEEPDNEANPRCRRPDEDCLPMSAEKYAEIMGTPQ